MAFELSITLEIVPEGTSIGGAGVGEWEDAADVGRVMIMGPMDKRVCPRCMPHVGKVYAADDPRIAAWTLGSGMHPNCRHWAEPLPPGGAEAVVPPGGDDGPLTGPEALEDMIDDGGDAAAAAVDDALEAPRNAMLSGQAVDVEDATKGIAPTVEVAPPEHGKRARKLSRSERARLSHKAMSKEKEAIATANEIKVANVVGGRQTPDNEPFDILLNGHGIEVKSIIAGKNPKITMHPASLSRKHKAARKLKVKTHTVVIDERTGKIYYRDGLGSFRLSSMEQLDSLDDLPKRLRVKPRRRRRSKP